MSVYRKEYQILSSDADMYRTLRQSALVTWMQEAAIAHTTQLGVTREKTLDKGLLWVIMQYRIELNRMPRYDEKVTLLSWPGKTMHLLFPRYFEMTGKDGETLVSASSVWTLMSRETRQVVFPEQHGIFIAEELTGREIALPARIRSQVARQTALFSVPYSYGDLNGHMNNARYFDLAQDHMPDELRKRPVKEISADYISEARTGDEITLGITAGEDSFYMTGERDKLLFKVCYLFFRNDSMFKGEKGIEGS